VILTDTSVIIGYGRGKDSKLLALLPTLPVAICGIVRAELLCGARSAADRMNLISLLSPFLHIPIEDAIWDTVGNNLAELRSKGITVPFPDAVVATLGIHNDVEVWARDAHFPAMQQVLTKLKLFQEPP
jgi:predicted nucleic acid-binding protein